MATLTPLYITGTKSYPTNTLVQYSYTSSWSEGSAIASNPHSSMNTAAALDTSQTSGDVGIGLPSSNNTAVTVQFDLSSVDTDFGSMVTFRREWSAAQFGTYSDDTGTLAYRIMTSDGSTVLYALNSGGTHGPLNHFNGTGWTTVDGAQLSPTYNEGTAANQYLNATATKADWDGAYLEVVFTDSRNMGPDNAAIILVDFRFTGTYTPLADRQRTLGKGLWTPTRRPLHVGALY